MSVVSTKFTFAKLRPQEMTSGFPALWTVLIDTLDL